MVNKIRTIVLIFIFFIGIFFVKKTFACTATTSCNGCNVNYTASDSTDCSCACQQPKPGGGDMCVDPGCHAECDRDAVGCPVGSVTAKCNDCAPSDDDPPPTSTPIPTRTNTPTPTPTVPSCDASMDSMYVCYNSQRPSGSCQDASLRMRSSFSNKGSIASSIGYNIKDANNSILDSGGTFILNPGAKIDTNVTNPPFNPVTGTWPDFGLVYCGCVTATTSCIGKTDINPANNSKTQCTIPQCPQLPTATPTPTTCPAPPAPTLRSPTNNSVFVFTSNLFIDLVINPITRTCGPNGPEYFIEFTFPSGGPRFTSGWISQTSWHTGPYGRTGTSTWRAKARYKNTQIESGWTNPWVYHIVTPTPTVTPTSINTPTPTTITGTPTPTTTQQANPWFQVKGGDVHIKQVPTPPFPINYPLILNPGITPLPFFLDNISGNPDSTGIFSTSSENGPKPGGIVLSPLNPPWLVTISPFSFQKVHEYDYSYFDSVLTKREEVPLQGSYILSGNTLTPDSNPSQPTKDLSSNIFKIWKIEGDLTIDNQISNNLGPLIFLTEGTITINYNITSLTDTYLMFVSKGDIIINNNVEKINGIFISDGAIQSTTSDKQLILEGGMVIAYDPNNAFSLGRILSNNNIPAEQFIFNPTYLIKFSNLAGKSSMLWQEIIP